MIVDERECKETAFASNLLLWLAVAVIIVLVVVVVVVVVVVLVAVACFGYLKPGRKYARLLALNVSEFVYDLWTPVDPID